MSWARFGVLSTLGFVMVFGGCGDDGQAVDDEARAELESVGGKADVPVWLRHIPIDWGCDATLNGRFVGFDSAHLYSFPGKLGYEHTFTFKADYAPKKGAVVAVYDSETGRRVAYARERWDNSVKVVYKAEKSLKYLVAVYSVAVTATGNYTLRAACKRLFITCQGDASCAKGEFCKFDSGCGATGLGTCTIVPKVCTKDYRPVCGCNGSTYGNACEAASAGVSVDHTGPCVAGTQCQKAGGYCTHWMTACQGGFLGGAPMDCPMGRSGKCCLPAVTITTDRTGYQVGEPVTAVVTNGTKESIFLGGCAVYSWEVEESDGWVNQGPEKVCVWEGLGREVKAGDSHTETLYAKVDGTYRLAAGYGIGCTPGKPLSQAGCKSTGLAYSETLKTRTCKMLGMPNPNSFCPTGKMEPKWDEDGICIASYVCLPCETKDCGPALGMPNTLCADGQTLAGPTGKCLASGWGTCSWEVIKCPE